MLKSLRFGSRGRETEGEDCMRRDIWEGGKRGWAVLALCAATAIALPAQTFTVLYDSCSQVGCIDGMHPSPSLIQGPDGNLYGGAFAGGLYQAGTIFKLTPKGKETVLYSFCAQQNCADGEQPYAGLVLDQKGNLYGTTSVGGAGQEGVVFKLTPKGKETVLHSFPECVTHCTDGEVPLAGVIFDQKGNLYGTTQQGGAYGGGIVFKLTP